MVKRIKCDLFLIVGYPYKSDCHRYIDVDDDFKIAAKQMNEAGWRKCGGINGNMPGWGYFCPDHATANQLYVAKEGLNGQI